MTFHLKKSYIQGFTKILTIRSLQELLNCLLISVTFFSNLTTQVLPINFFKCRQTGLHVLCVWESKTRSMYLCEQKLLYLITCGNETKHSISPIFNDFPHIMHYLKGKIMTSVLIKLLNYIFPSTPNRPLRCNLPQYNAISANRVGYPWCKQNI